MAAPKTASGAPRGEPKMDPTRAQGLLGFSSSRWMDPTAGVEPKDALDRALFEQMNRIQAKKRQSLQKKVLISNLQQNAKIYRHRPIFFAHCTCY